MEYIYSQRRLRALSQSELSRRLCYLACKVLMHLFNCGCARNTRLLPLNKTIILQEVHRGSRFTVNQRHYNEYRLPPLPQARSVPTAVGAHLVLSIVYSNKRVRKHDTHIRLQACGTLAQTGA